MYEKGHEIKVTNKVKKLLQRKKECSKKNNNSENLIKKNPFLKSDKNNIIHNDTSAF